MSTESDATSRCDLSDATHIGSPLMPDVPSPLSRQLHCPERLSDSGSSNSRGVMSFSDLSVHDSSETMPEVVSSSSMTLLSPKSLLSLSMSAAALEDTPSSFPSYQSSLCSSTVSVKMSASSSLLAAAPPSTSSSSCSTTASASCAARAAPSPTLRAPVAHPSAENTSMPAPQFPLPLPSQSRSKSSKSPSPKQSPRDEGMGVSWPEELLSAYKNIGILGHGTFGSVYKACNINDASRVVAIKVFQIALASHCVLPRALSDNECATEASLMQKLSHPHILKIHDILSDAEYMCLVLEHAPGGNMFDRIIESGASLYTELSCCALLHKILTALAYMHEQGVCHRDLKPENILFRGPQCGDTAARVEPGEDALGFHEPVITDFGLAVHVPDHRELQPLQRVGCPPLPPHDPSRDVTYLGTLGYCAPEMLDPSTRKVPHHGFAADVWSFGVLAYICLSGCHPLDLTGEDEDCLVAHRTRMGDVIPMAGKYWENVSEQARTFISRCLRVNPAERPSFQDCLSDPWFESCRASDREFAQLQENFERIVHLSASQLKHKRRWRSLVHWAIGIGAFATAKRKAREAAGKEAPQALQPSRVQSCNTNKLAKFASSVDGDRRKSDAAASSSAVTAVESRESDELLADLLLSSSSGRPHISASGSSSSSAAAGSSACLSASVSKRSSHDLHSPADELILIASAGSTLTMGSGVANAKRAAAFTISPPNAGSHCNDSGSSSPVTDILSKRASDDIEHNAAGVRAFEKRTNDGGQRDRRNSD